MGFTKTVKIQYLVSKRHTAQTERDKTMGNRRNVELKYESGAKIYLYTHWGGTELPSIVSRALERGKDRWDNESYLARIIFSEMTQREEMSLTGYGISPYPPDEEHAHITIDFKDQKANGLPFELFIKQNKEAHNAD